MTNRIIDLSESQAFLRVKHEQLVIERKDCEPVGVPLKDVSVVILAHPQVTCTHAVFSGVMENGGAIVTCNHQNLPVGLMLPINGHCTQTERFIAQAQAPVPTRKRIWKQIVAYKIRSQSNLLDRVRGAKCGLAGLAGKVRSGDPSNIEAQAARRYWPLLFDDVNFRRRRDGDDQNRILNYGYAVLRATVGRAICSAGLHPSLGVHHHNRYNPFCLADDLMEPYRPFIDAAAVEHVATFGSDAPLTTESKRILLTAISESYESNGEVRTLFDFVSRTASSLAKVFLKQSDSLFYPEVFKNA